MGQLGWDELKYMDWLKDKVPVDAKILDCGANIGDFTIEWLKRFPMSEVFCLEPIVEIFNTLSHRLEGIPNVHLYNFGLFNETCEHEIFFVQQEHHGMSCLWDRPRYFPNFEVQKRIIQLKKFDEISDQFPKVDFIKVDCEGAELRVFQGMREYLIRNKPYVQLEVGECINDAGVTFKEIIDFLYGIGYKVLNRDFNYITPENVWENTDCQNYLCVPR